MQKYQYIIKQSRHLHVRYSYNQTTERKGISIFWWILGHCLGWEHLYFLKTSAWRSRICWMRRININVNKMHTSNWELFLILLYKNNLTSFHLISLLTGDHLWQTKAQRSQSEGGSDFGGALEDACGLWSFLWEHELHFKQFSAQIKKCWVNSKLICGVVALRDACSHFLVAWKYPNHFLCSNKKRWPAYIFWCG